MKDRSINPANFFLLASLIIGILYCIFIPYGAGFDEERHLARIYYMSQNEFMPNFPNPTIHNDVFELSYQRRFTQSPAFDMYTSEGLGKKFSTLEEDIQYGYRTQSIYSPVIFLPQAIIGRALWWKFNFPILPTIMLQKIAGLLIYIAGAYVAIRVLPYGKWIFAALALSPAALYQAATLNADGFNVAASFAFIGWVVAVYVNEGSGIRPRSVWILAALTLWLGLAKPGAIILLPLLLLLVKHPFPSKKWMLVLGMGVIFAVAANIGWWSLASQGSTFSEGGDQSVARQSSQILADPMGFIKPLVQGLILTFPDQIKGWVASYGYWAGTVPGPVYFFSALFMLAAFLAEPHYVKIPKPARIFLVGLFFFCSLGIYTIAFAANYATGGVLALAKHGRYYIPFAPLLFLGISGVFILRENLQKLMRAIAVVSFLLVTIYHSLGIYTAYYTYCGYEAYAGEKCTLPIYKNLEKEDAGEAVLSDGNLVKQSFTNQCGTLEMVSVFVNDVSENSTGLLRFTLFDGNEQVITSHDHSINEITPYSYLDIPVTVPANFSSRDFEFQLEAVDLEPAEEIRLTLTPSDYYPGQLSVNGTEIQRDLLIHYTCTSP